MLQEALLRITALSMAIYRVHASACQTLLDFEPHLSPRAASQLALAAIL